MKKTALFLFLLPFFINLFFLPVSASESLIKPGSKVYFLQSWGESIKLFFTFSQEQKISYILELTDKRVNEMSTSPSLAVATRYQEHFEKLGELTNQIPNKQQVTEKIKETNIRQQEVLARVYNQVPDKAKEAIINAQENSAKHVIKTLETVEGSQKAQDYQKKVAEIQQAEKIGQVEQAPMESSPNANPGEFTPKELKETNQQNQLNPLKPGSENGGGRGGEQMQPVQPIQMNQPGNKN